MNQKIDEVREQFLDTLRHWPKSEEDLVNRFGKPEDTVTPVAKRAAAKKVAKKPVAKKPAAKRATKK